MAVISLDNVQYAEFASEGTLCFNADVYLDNVRMGEVSNDGRGGAHRYAITNEEMKSLDRAAKPYAYNRYCVFAEANDHEPAPYDDFSGSLEWVVDDLMNLWLLRQQAEAITLRVRSVHGLSPDSVRVFVVGNELVALCDNRTDEQFVENNPGAIRVPEAVAIDLQEV